MDGRRPNARPNDARARALVDVTDPLHAVIIEMNLAAELSAGDLGISVGSVVDPLLIADPETIAASTANFDRLMAGEIDSYDTFSYLADSTGAAVTLQMTLRIGSGPDPDGMYLELDWHEVGMPSVADIDPDEEVLDVAQLITTGALADAPLGVALIDAARNRYVTVNHAFASILGLPRRELVDQSTEVGRFHDVESAANASDILAVVRGSLSSLTIQLPVISEPRTMRTATLHPIGARDQHARYLLLFLIERTRTAADDEGDARADLSFTTPLPSGVYARAVVDPDWRLRHIEPPLATWGLEHDRLSHQSVFPAIDPADLPSFVAAADIVRSGQTDRAVTRVHYRAAGPDPGYLSTECEITAEPGLPEGWLVFSNRLVGAGGKEIPIADRLRAITLAALAEDTAEARGSRDAAAVAASIGAAHDLTPRETEILALIIDGSRVSTIARTLHVTDGTVRNYLSAIFHKVGVRNQAELVEFAVVRRDGAV